MKMFPTFSLALILKDILFHLTSITQCSTTMRRIHYSPSLSKAGNFSVSVGQRVQECWGWGAVLEAARIQ